MQEPKTSVGRSIKVGVITDQTGALSFLGIANANVAKMVINDINAKGGLLGRRIDLYLEDSATTDSAAEAKATKLVQQDQVDVIFGGIYSSTRQAIKGPAVVNGKKLYIYPEQYEGQECDPLIFCTGPVPAQQVEPLIPWLMQQTGAKNFYLPSADYIWPHTLNKKVREVATANGGAVVGEEYFPLDHTDYSQTIEKITSSGAEVGEAGSLRQEDVIKALDHAKIAEGPGGPAGMVPGQHHVRMNMYIAQANDGDFKIVESLGAIDPKECMQGIK